MFRGDFRFISLSLFGTRPLVRIAPVESLGGIGCSAGSIRLAFKDVRRKAHLLHGHVVKAVSITRQVVNRRLLLKMKDCITNECDTRIQTSLLCRFSGMRCTEWRCSKHTVVSFIPFAFGNCFTACLEVSEFWNDGVGRKFTL